MSSLSSGCSCGPAQAKTWTNQRLTCSVDVLGHVRHQDFDDLGRLTRAVEYGGGSCTVPATLPPDSRDSSYGYGVTRLIAQGVTLSLDVKTSSTRPSALGGSSLVGDTYDYDQTSNPSIDPPSYACTTTALPAGSVMCRTITTGYVPGTGATPVLERHATFFSYDARGRLIRTYGPVNLDYWA